MNWWLGPCLAVTGGDCNGQFRGGEFGGTRA